MELTILIFSSNTLNGWKPYTKSTCFTQWFLRDHTDPIIRIWLSNLFDSKASYIIIGRNRLKRNARFILSHDRIALEYSH